MQEAPNTYHFVFYFFHCNLKVKSNNLKYYYFIIIISRDGLVITTTIVEMEVMKAKTVIQFIRLVRLKNFLAKILSVLVNLTIVMERMIVGITLMNSIVVSFLSF